VEVRSRSREEQGPEARLTGATEWHRAGIAISGVTLVLGIAAGIHFIAPPRSTQGDISPSTAAARLPTVAAAAPTFVPPTLVLRTFDETALEPLQLASPLRTRVLSPHQVEQVRPAGAFDSLEPSGGAGEPVLAAPLDASLEAPEDSLLLVAPMHMPVNAEFVEPALHAVESDSESSGDAAARVARQRDPVTAAFVTAGSAVAGGFRSAGRALRRAF
jgi:hypothetical protein